MHFILNAGGRGSPLFSGEKVLPSTPNRIAGPSRTHGGPVAALAPGNSATRPVCDSGLLSKETRVAARSQATGATLTTRTIRAARAVRASPCGPGPPGSPGTKVRA